MYRPCAHCGSEKGYDPEYCPSICEYGEMLKEQTEHEKAVKEWRAVEFPVNMSDLVYYVRDNGVEICRIVNIKSKVLGSWVFRISPIGEDWLLALRGTYFEVNLAQYDKTWFKDRELAQSAYKERRAKKHGKG